jgi:hypothetical protein
MDEHIQVWNELTELFKQDKIEVTKRSYCGIARSFKTKDNKIQIEYGMVHWLETFKVFVDEVMIVDTRNEDVAFKAFLDEYRKTINKES